jgi:hypothetical protein
MCVRVLQQEGIATPQGMFGSCHDGEVAAAGRSAHILHTDAGTSWSEVLMSPDGAGSSDRNKLAEAEAKNRRLVIELAQRQRDIDKHPQEIRELQTAKHREKTCGFASIKTAIGRATMGFAFRTVAGWAAMGFAAWFIWTMFRGPQTMQESRSFAADPWQPPSDPRPGGLTACTRG